MDEKFCLKWNDFQENALKTFSKLRNEDDFFDVTLVADDQKDYMQISPRSFNLLGLTM